MVYKVFYPDDEEDKDKARENLKKELMIAAATEIMQTAVPLIGHYISQPFHGRGIDASPAFAIVSRDFKRVARLLRDMLNGVPLNRRDFETVLGVMTVISGLPLPIIRRFLQYLDLYEKYHYPREYKRKQRVRRRYKRIYRRRAEA